MKLSDLLNYRLELILLFLVVVLGADDTLYVAGISECYLLLIALAMCFGYPLCRTHARRTSYVSPDTLEMYLLFTSHLIWLEIYMGLVLILISKVIGLFQPYTLQMLLNNGILFGVSVCVAGVTYRFLVKLFSSRCNFMRSKEEQS